MPDSCPFPRARRCLPLFWLAALLGIQGCASSGKTAAPDEESPERVEAADNAVAFRLDVVSPNRGVARHLERHMELQRFTDFDDLQANELRRLLAAAEENARDLLAAQGYFQPRLELRTEASRDADDPRRIVMEVDPGERSKVLSHEILFAAPMDEDERGARQRREIRRDWLLKDGDAFAQETWDAAKAAGLRVLQRERYPTARIEESQAIVNAATAQATLGVTYDAGEHFRFGELELELDALKRYSPTGIRNIARIPTGEDYSEQALLDAQQRLAGSGYFDSVFLVLDTEASDPGAARVVAQLTEARYQKIVFGLGFSTDDGPRVSVDHTHNRMWPLRWRAQNKVAVGTETQSLDTQWTAMPAASGWAWYTGLSLSRSEFGDYKANSVSAIGGRMREADRTERRYFVQYDASKAEGGEAPGASSSILGNYTWTGRYFNNPLNPTSGRGFGLESGIGLTLSPDRDPFLRLVARGLQLVPFGGRNSVGKRNRLALRAEAGAVVADEGVNIPVRLLFLTGGDTTVRGYSYQSIGNRLDDGSIYGGRYMAMGSVEWQRPISLFGDARSLEHAVFIDAGSASDNLRDSVVYTGVGTGIRWSSPVGPLQADVAYGLRTEKWRVHLRVGFQF
jgi:translocation and assembly module TamA